MLIRIIYFLCIDANDIQQNFMAILSKSKVDHSGYTFSIIIIMEAGRRVWMAKQY